MVTFVVAVFSHPVSVLVTVTVIAVGPPAMFVFIETDFSSFGPFIIELGVCPAVVHKYV
jgi:hypothetical protein